MQIDAASYNLWLIGWPLFKCCYFMSIVMLADNSNWCCSLCWIFADGCTLVHVTGLLWLAVCINNLSDTCPDASSIISPRTWILLLPVCLTEAMLIASLNWERTFPAVPRDCGNSHYLHWHFTAVCAMVSAWPSSWFRQPLTSAPLATGARSGQSRVNDLGQILDSSKHCQLPHSSIFGGHLETLVAVLSLDQVSLFFGWCITSGRKSPKTFAVWTFYKHLDRFAQCVRGRASMHNDAQMLHDRRVFTHIWIDIPLNCLQFPASITLLLWKTSWSDSRMECNTTLTTTDTVQCFPH